MQLWASCLPGWSPGFPRRSPVCRGKPALQPGGRQRCPSSQPPKEIKTERLRKSAHATIDLSVQVPRRHPVKHCSQATTSAWACATAAKVACRRGRRTHSERRPGPRGPRHTFTTPDQADPRGGSKPTRSGFKASTWQAPRAQHTLPCSVEGHGASRDLE